MDANTKYTLFVFNTCTQKYEEVTVSEEVYRTYCRTGWNIKDNDQSFFDHEIQLSGMIGSQDGAYENFREFVDSVDTPENKKHCTKRSRHYQLRVAAWYRVYFLMDSASMNMRIYLVFRALRYTSGKCGYSRLSKKL